MTHQPINSAPIFITGIGTGVGKTLVAAIVAKALDMDYWKPVQAGMDGGTDSEWVRNMLQYGNNRVHEESYKLKTPASPHIAARYDGISVSLQKIRRDFEFIQRTSAADGRALVVEGAGGLLVPLNEKDFVIDLVEKLGARVILVSRNYLGSINHSLLTATVSRMRNLQVMGWIFNDQYLDYEDEIVTWSGFPKLGSIPHAASIDQTFIQDQGKIISGQLRTLLC